MRKTWKTRVAKAGRSFQKDERGLSEAVMTALLTAVGAAILIISYNVFWKDGGLYSIQTIVGAVVNTFGGIFKAIK